ncbi:hypothetical protein M0R19_00210 [Candidatus Pacearchaeota archaeon]|jgi:hypothetical protein|nr:hypothetical protein [Candidatus Pacearchaeota archaeon]
MVRILKNKRGDIPTTILVIGVLLICTIALFSFFSSTIKVGNSFVGIGLVEKLNSQVEARLFRGENPAGLYVEKKATKGFLFWSKEVLLFSSTYQSQP